MPLEDSPLAPSLPWRASSAVVLGVSGMLCRAFLYGGNRVTVNGLDGFLNLLDKREDVEGRERGLITVSNHISVMDDPLMWGVLPLKYLWNPNAMRWSLGSHDIVFKNKALEKFFTLGQTLPTHRLAHSIHGGPFQPTMTQSIRLLSQQPFKHHPNKWPGAEPQMSLTDISDPFSSNQLIYSTNGHDTFPAPSAFLSRRHSWVHVFPEGKTHQKQDYTMRYFKWGVARLILESEPCPDLVPIWIEGLDRVMHESRKWPRFIPRVGKDINVTFGKQVDVDAAFGDLRRRWRMLLVRERGPDPREVSELGVIPDPLKYGSDAVKLREECALRVRDELLKVRRQRGWADEDPKARLVDTWREEGKQGKQGKQEGKMADGSWVKDT